MANWQYRYNICKDSNLPLFSNPVSEWSGWQVWLAHWCEWYYQILKSEDHPANYVIEDDFLLDQWLMNRKKKYDHEKRVRESNSSSGRNVFSKREEFKTGDYSQF